VRGSLARGILPARLSSLNAAERNVDRYVR
jgi:hypothetical protein